jgi:hypothetical protein
MLRSDCLLDGAVEIPNITRILKIIKENFIKKRGRIRISDSGGKKPQILIRNTVVK